MIFKELRLKNIGPFESYTVTFSAGQSQIVLGNAEGKTTVIHALRSVLCFDADPQRLLKDGASESSVKLQITFGKKDATIEKKWKAGAVSAWKVSIDDRTMNLLNYDEAVKWKKWWLQQCDGDETEPYPEMINDRYAFLTALMFDSSADLLQSLMKESFVDRCFMTDAYSNAYQHLIGIESHIGEEINKSKLISQERARDSKKIGLLTKEIAQIEIEIQNKETLAHQLEQKLSGEQKDMHQASRIHEFIENKKDELHKIEFELKTYRSIIDNNTLTDLSDEELAEIDEKRKRYENLSKRIIDYEQRLIERAHLEKNLIGLQQELRRFKKAVVPAGEEADDDVPSPKQIAVYENESKRIEQKLKSYADLELEIDQLKQERQEFRTAYDQFQVFSKTKKLFSQNDSKKIKSAIQKLDDQKKIIVKELEELQTTVHEDKYAKLLRSSQEMQQQSLEISKHIAELIRRKSTLAVQLQELEKPVNEEDEARRQISLKRYIKIVQEGLAFLKNRQFEQSRETFIKKLSSKLPKPYRSSVTGLIKILFSPEHSPEAKHATLLQLSQTETLLIGLMLRITMIDQQTKIRTIILDEHHRQLLDAGQTQALHNWLDQCHFEQSISLVQKQS
ncbi:hypothetical protein K1X84_06625 [bacterium]|nr:hypothetical protein [bacterium]